LSQGLKGSKTNINPTAYNFLRHKTGCQGCECTWLFE